MKWKRHFNTKKGISAGYFYKNISVDCGLQIQCFNEEYLPTGITYGQNFLFLQLLVCMPLCVPISYQLNSYDR